MLPIPSVNVTTKYNRFSFKTGHFSAVKINPRNLKALDYPDMLSPSCKYPPREMWLGLLVSNQPSPVSSEVGTQDTQTPLRRRARMAYYTAVQSFVLYSDVGKERKLSSDVLDIRLKFGCCGTLSS